MYSNANVNDTLMVIIVWCCDCTHNGKVIATLMRALVMLTLL